MLTKTRVFTRKEKSLSLDWLRNLDPSNVELYHFAIQTFANIALLRLIYYIKTHYEDDYKIDSYYYEMSLFNFYRVHFKFFAEDDCFFHNVFSLISTDVKN